MAVCVNPSWIPLVSELLNGSETLPITVVGFPLGAMTSTSKAFEAQEAITLGAREIDMVINLSAAKDGDWVAVEKDIQAVLKATKSVPLKVILETSFLTEDEIALASKACLQAGAAFVKTSTGFGARGASVEDIQIIKSVVGESMGIKASGGIRDVETFRAMVAAGATRVGSSSSVKILAELKK